MNLAEIPQIQTLSSKEKLELIKEIWSSIEDFDSSFPITEEEKAVLNSRWTEHLANPASAITMEELQKRLKSRL